MILQPRADRAPVCPRHSRVRCDRDRLTNHLGIVTVDRREKLAFRTLQKLVSLLDAGTLTIADGEIDANPIDGTIDDVYRHLFVRPDGRQVLIAWAKRSDVTLDIALRRKGGRATEYALTGTASPYDEFADGILRRVRLAARHVRIFEITGTN